MSDTTVLFSGGPDSTAVVLWALDQGLKPELLTFQFFDAWQDGEIRSAMNVADALDLQHVIIDLKGIYASVGGAPPPMHGSDRIADESPYLQKRLPFAMSIVLSLTGSIAHFRSSRKILWGATKDDGREKYEYTPKFSSALAEIMNASEPDKDDIEIATPISDRHKWEAMLLYKDREELLSLTWSCIKDGRVQCGQCGACVARRVAAKAAGLKDLTRYRDKNFPTVFSEKELSRPEEITAESWGKVAASPKGPD